MSHSPAYLPLIFILAITCTAHAVEPSAEAPSAVPATPGTPAGSVDPVPPSGSSDSDNNPKPGSAAGPASLGLPQCYQDSRKSDALCSQYMKDFGGEVKPEVSGDFTQDRVKQLRASLQQQIDRSKAAMYRCAAASETCQKACGASGPYQVQKCAQEKRRAVLAHSKLARGSQSQIARLDEVDGASRSRPDDNQGPSGERNPAASGGAPIGHTSPPTTPHSTTPQSAQNSNPTPSNNNPSPATPKDNQPEKTLEQQKVERQEKRAEERRQERIDALSKAFMNLNQQSSPGQALQERNMTVEAQNTAAAAAKATEKSQAAKSATKTTPKDDDDENGRVGFNALAKQNLAARKAIAASLGINSANLQGTAVMNTAPAVTGRGTIFAAGRGFEHSADQATLDPVMPASEYSNLPRNFKLGAPSAGGSRGSNSADINIEKSPRTRKPASQNPESLETPPLRAVAGLDHRTEILRPSADIWAVMSTAFRTRCAEGRLMDCAEHLPKH